MKSAGVLLHISSLPSKYGIGSLGKEAYAFVDFLKSAGQKIWQILPIGPTSYGDSPYQALSAFAFNPYFIDLEELVKDKLLSIEDLPTPIETKRVNYGALFNERYHILHKAYKNKNLLNEEFQKFVNEENYWLHDYAMYMVLKEEQENRSWNTWYDDFKYRREESLNWLSNQYAERIEEWKFYQFLFYKQWMKLKKYANRKGIEIMGDMPIYCAYDSSDVWANPKMFQLDNRLNPTRVAGCPPDAFSADGQLWGNPLYAYDRMKEDGYSWWIKRVKHSLKVFDILRIDHFRGFAGYYSIPFGDTTAKNGYWVEGPGYELFKAIEKVCPNAKIVAENLGYLTPDVHKLLKDCKYPGMNIFQFELGDYTKKAPIYKKYPENNLFYSGTHDNQLLESFYHQLDKKGKAMVDKICNIKFTDRPSLKIIEYCMKNNAKYCIIPIQDYLGLSDSDGRMNIPSTASGNWSYISKKSDYSKELCEYMKNLAIESDRYTE